MAGPSWVRQTDYVAQVKDILNPKGHQTCIIGSTVTVIWLNGLIFPIGGVASVRVCACSLRIVYSNFLIFIYYLLSAFFCSLRSNFSLIADGEFKGGGVSGFCVMLVPRII